MKLQEAGIKMQYICFVYPYEKMLITLLSHTRLTEKSRKTNMQNFRTVSAGGQSAGVALQKVRDSFDHALQKLKGYFVRARTNLTHLEKEKVLVQISSIVFKCLHEPLLFSAAIVNFPTS